MNRINKEDMFNLIVNKINVKENEYNIISKIVDEIYDISKKEIIPLDNNETFLFRKKYGIYDNGIPQTQEYISKEYNIGYTKLRKMLDNIFIKLAFRIKKIENQINIVKMSSIDNLDNKDELENISVASLEISIPCKNRLMKQFIFTLKQLMGYSTIELKQILSNKSYLELLNYVHSLNILFLDELSFDDKKQIFNSSIGNVIYDSSIYWLDSVKNIETERLNDLHINNIRTLMLNANFLSINDHRKILEEFKNLISNSKKIK